MRLLLAALAIAGGMMVSFAHADDERRDRALVLAYAGTSAADVIRAKRCAPPIPRPTCKRKPRGSVAPTMLAAVDTAAIAERVPLQLARALVRVESNFVAGVVGAEGEIGLTQIKLSTARGLGFRGSRAALFDPETNLTWGLRHARRALDRGSIGFHQAGLGARRVSSRYVARINAAMR